MAQQSSPDINQILSTIRQVESSNDYGAQAKGSSASGAYQFIDSTWQASTKKAGLGTEYSRAKDAPPEVQDAVAAFAVRDILNRAGGDVAKVPLVWYTGNPEGRMTEEAIRANQGLTADKYQQKWLSVLGGGATTRQASTQKQAPRTTAQGPKQIGARVASAFNPGDLPSSYTSALALNYLADTDPEGVTMSKVNEMLAEMMEDGGGAAKPAGGKILQQFAQAKSVDPFQFVLQQEEPAQPKQRAVPRMPKMFADGGLVATAANLQRPILKPEEKEFLAERQKEFADYISQAEKYNEALDNYQKQYAAYEESMKGNPDYAAYTKAVEDYSAKVKEYQEGGYKNLLGASAEYSPYVAHYEPKYQSYLLYQGDPLNPSGEWGGSPDRYYREGDPDWGQYSFVQTGTSRNIYTGQPSSAGYLRRVGTQSTPIGDFTAKAPGSPPAEFTMEAPTAPTGLKYTWDQVQEYQKNAMTRAAKAARNRATALQVITGQGPYAGFGLSLFANGGEVDYNQMAEQMTVGTIPTEGQIPAGQAFQNVGRDIVRGAQYLPYDLAGAPVDIINLGLTPFGLGSDKPFMGSEYLIDKAAQAGIADRPTGSAAETVTRIGMGFVNPAAGARQIGRGIEGLTDAVTAPIDRAKIRAAASRAPEDVTYDPLRERLESQGILSLATRPKGTAINPEQDMKELIRAASSARDNSKVDITNNLNLLEKSFVPKLKNYLNRQFGTVDDPLYEATISGKFLPQGFYRPNSIFRFEEQRVADVTGLELKNGLLTMEHMNKLQQLAKQKDEKAIKLLGEGYDTSGQTRAMYPSTNPLSEVDIYRTIKKEAGDRPMTIGPISPELAYLEDYATPFGSEYTKDLSTKFSEELRRGKPVYEMTGTRTFGGVIDYDDLIQYTLENDPAKWTKMSVPELVLASNQDISKVIDPVRIAKYAFKGKELVPFQKLLGTETYLPLSNSPALGKGAEWREIKTKEALLTEGGRSMLNHCLKSNTEYCNMLQKGEAKYFSLRDVDGHPHATIMIERSGDKGPYNLVSQIKGFENSNTMPLYGEEVSDFLTSYEKTLGEKLKFSEDPSYVPIKYTPKQFGITDPERNNRGDDWNAVGLGNVYAKGGMVDKPLYDRAQ